MSLSFVQCWGAPVQVSSLNVCWDFRILSSLLFLLFPSLDILSKEFPSLSKFSVSESANEVKLPCLRHGPWGSPWGGFIFLLYSKQFTFLYSKQFMYLYSKQFTISININLQLQAIYVFIFQTIYVFILQAIYDLNKYKFTTAIQ